MSRRLRLLLVAAVLGASVPVFASDYAGVQQLLRAGQAAQALEQADAYLAKNPRDPQMRFLRGVILTESGRTTEAIGAFTRLIEDYPELPEPYNNLAVLLAQQNQLEKARAALEMAVRTNPNYATAHENLGDVYVRLAGQSYGRAAQLDPKAPSVPPKLALVRELLAPGKTPAANPAPGRARTR